MNWGCLRRRRSTTGSFARSSCHTSRTAATPDNTARPVTSFESNQSSRSPRSSMSCTAPTAMTSSPMPMASMFLVRLWSGLSWTYATIMATARIPTGTLMKKIQGHE